MIAICDSISDQIFLSLTDLVPKNVLTFTWRQSYTAKIYRYDSTYDCSISLFPSTIFPHQKIYEARPPHVFSSLNFQLTFHDIKLLDQLPPRVRLRKIRFATKVKGKWFDITLSRSIHFPGKITFALLSVTSKDWKLQIC